MTDKVQKIRAFLVGIADADGVSTILAEAIEKKILPYIDSLQKESVREDYEIYGSVAAVKALDRKRVCPQLKGNTLHKFKNEFNTIKQIVHLLYDYEDPFCYRVALHWASWGAYNLKSFGNINEKEKAKMDISEELVSEDLEEACEQLAENARKHKAKTSSPFFSPIDYKQGVMDGVQWQKKQLITKAVETTFNVSLPSGLYDKLWIKGCKDWDKLLVIKKDEL